MRLSLPFSSSRSISVSHSCLATSVSTLVFSYCLYVWNNRVNTMEYSRNCSKTAGSSGWHANEISWSCDISKLYSANEIPDSVQFSRSVMSDSLWLHELQHVSPHHLPELAQTHVHWVSDAVQPSHPLSSPSPHALNLSQHQGLFKWVGSSHQVAKVLEFQLQHQSF